MKTIGIIGGMDWQGTAVYYETINTEVRRRLGGSHCARIVIDSLNFHPIASAQGKAEFLAVRETLIASAKRLEVAGADVIVIACNTVHRFADAVANAVSIPLLHIADAAGSAVAEAGHRRVGLLGTGPTMQGAFYRRYLTDRFAIETLTPAADTIMEIHQLILNELATGKITSNAKPLLDAAIAELAKANCTAVLLACTEFGLVYGNEHLPGQNVVPLFNSAIVHSLAVADWAIQ